MSMTPDQEHSWASLAHMAALVGLLVPFGGLLAPYLVLRLKGPQSAFVAAQAREALNFNITAVLAGLLCLALTWVLIGGLLLVALVLYWIIMTLVATVQAGEGHEYRYPITLRLVKP